MVDPSGELDYWWSGLLTIVVLYNCTVLVARVVFKEMEANTPLLWTILDYTGDFIYLLDMIFRARYVFLEILWRRYSYFF